VKHDDSIDEDDIEALASPVKQRTRLRRLGSLDQLDKGRDGLVRQLYGMGFTDRTQALEALEHTGNNVEEAVDWLLAPTRLQDASSDEVQVIEAPSSLRTRNGVHVKQAVEASKTVRDEPKPAETELEKLIQKCEQYSKRLGSVMTAFNANVNDSDANNNSTQMEQQPQLLERPLKDYQLIGMNWLYTLHKEGLNGILADESK
jgi:hypothetical protein